MVFISNFQFKHYSFTTKLVLKQRKDMDSVLWASLPIFVQPCPKTVLTLSLMSSHGNVLSTVVFRETTSSGENSGRRPKSCAAQDHTLLRKVLFDLTGHYFFYPTICWMCSSTMEKHNAPLHKNVLPKLTWKASMTQNEHNDVDAHQLYHSWEHKRGEPIVSSMVLGSGSPSVSTLLTEEEGGKSMGIL